MNKIMRKYGVFDKEEKKHQAGSVYDENYCSPTIYTATGGYRQPMVETNNNMRIRKLTPKECFRLMGVKDEDFEKIRKNQSDSSLYHLAGDSIVVNVLMAIFKEMIKNDRESKS